MQHLLCAYVVADDSDDNDFAILAVEWRGGAGRERVWEKQPLYFLYVVYRASEIPDCSN